LAAIQIDAMILRPLKPEDSRVLLEMWNAAAGFDPMTPELFEEKTLGDPDYDPILTLLCELEGELAGFFMGVVRQTADGPRGIIKLGAVAVNHRREGIGSKLLAAVEQALVDQGVTTFRVCESAPNYLVPGVDSRYRAAPRFFARHGYRLLGEATNMSVDLTARSFGDPAAEQVLAGRGVGVRRAVAGDREKLMRFLDDHWAEWKAEVAIALANNPPSLHLAERDDEFIAFSAWEANNRGTGWFGPMGTAPAARKLGIGRVLLLRCLADIAAQGQRTATIPWVGPVDFYSQCAGAVVSRTFNRYEKELRI
jgi:ribosomal protein S18 acetylase RimI-like enzyme